MSCENVAKKIICALNMISGWSEKRYVT